MKTIDLIKDISFPILNLCFGRLNTGASILMYHAIDESPAYSAVSPRVFERQLKFLQNSDYRVMLLSELVDKLILGQDIGGAVAITFDDGYQNIFESAFPLLEHYQMPATIFVCPGLFDSTFMNSQGFSYKVMTSTQVQEIARSSLIELQPHTFSHCVLNSIPIEQGIYEIERSRAYIQQNFQQKANIIAYPRGKFTAKVIEHLQCNNWSAAVTTIPGSVKNSSDLFTLPRNSVNQKTTASRFQANVSNTIDIYAACCQALKGQRAA